MLNEPPAYVKAAGVMGAPAKYEWNSDLAMDLDDVENDRLYDAINETSFRAKMAIAAALTEWIAWRLHGHVDITEALQRVEAAWASVIDPKYTKSLDFQGSADDDTERVKGPLEAALSHLGDAHEEYVHGSIYLAEPVMKLAMLARHLAPDKKRFDAWLSETLRRTAKTFPRGVQYDEDSERYDASAETPVARDFFEPGSKYSDAANQKAIRQFLENAQAKKNPYLRLNKK
jgi:hypothetical protein